MDNYEAWYSLDKEKATIEALMEYEHMTCIINLTPDEIKTWEERLISPGSSVIDGLPKPMNPHGREHMVVNGLLKINLMYQRYRQALEYMAWFKPAWDVLTEEEQIILSAYYMTGQNKKYAVEDLASKLYISQSNISRRKMKALKHLRILLFGC